MTGKRDIRDDPSLLVTLGKRDRLTTPESGSWFGILLIVTSTVAGVATLVAGVATVEIRFFQASKAETAKMH